MFKMVKNMTIKEYVTKRLIRGQTRKVKVKAKTVNGKRKESIKLLNPKRPRAYNKHLTRAEARKVHKKRSFRAKAADAKKTSRIDTTERYAKYPGKYDFPGVDTKNNGKNAGKGYGWKKRSKSNTTPTAMNEQGPHAINQNWSTAFRGDAIKMNRKDRLKAEKAAKRNARRAEKNNNRQLHDEWFNKWSILFDINKDLAEIETPTKLKNKRLKAIKISDKAVQIIDEAGKDTREWSGKIHRYKRSELDNLNISKFSPNAHMVNSEKIEMMRYYDSTALSYANKTKSNEIDFHTHPERLYNKLDETPINKHVDELAQNNIITQQEKRETMHAINQVFNSSFSDLDLKTLKTQKGTRTILVGPSLNAVAIQTNNKPFKETKWSQILTWAFIKSRVQDARNKAERQHAIQRYNDLVLQGFANNQSHNGIKIKWFKKGKSIKIDKNLI